MTTDPIEYDPVKIEEAVLALLGATEFEGGRAWKRYDFDVMRSLHEQGLISNPVGHAKSVWLTEEGLRRARQLAAERFGR